MKDLLDERRPGVPAPSTFSDLHLLEKLLLAARREVEATKSPCVYLGLSIGEHFEPNPAKWPSDALAGQWATHAPVWYEYPLRTAGQFCIRLLWE